MKNMRKEQKTAWILSTIVCLLPVLAGALLYNRLPDTMPIHWDLGGNANGWSSRFMGAIGLPGILLVLNLLLPTILKLDPKYKTMSGRMLAIIQWTIPAVSLFASSITLAAGLGIEVNVPFYATLFCGLLLTVVGNYLPKMSQSYTVGIKLPWTLDDEENWDRTHRFAGFVWVVCGLLLCVSAFLPFRGIAMGVLLACMVLGPVLYSWLLYRRKES